MSSGGLLLLLGLLALWAELTPVSGQDRPSELPERSGDPWKGGAEEIRVLPQGRETKEPRLEPLAWWGFSRGGSFCYLPADPRTCKINASAFYYNSASNSCQEFLYGGCKGNSNRFETKSECHHTCVGKELWTDLFTEKEPLPPKIKHRVA
ncbi:kunitz/BPTI-like toxin [Pseudonaja textilis]|uniref:kunitz/BPTI-like toxin n=1 Tax=Pseudonaja textilis TaxID=8673 RepID=UPI000EAA6BE1|nr:kunitz/BPTI-like toxin [Pseudonaja textilis]